MAKYKFQDGGDPYDSSDFFNLLAQMSQQPQPTQEEEAADTAQDPNQGDSDYEDLLQKYNDLQSQVDDFQNQVPTPQFEYQMMGDDHFLNFLFQDDERELPEFTGSRASTSNSAGVNPYLKQTESDLFSHYNLHSMGIWGDKAHQKRVSDHNTGDAEDFGFDSPQTADKVVGELQSQADKRNIKYIIYNKKIWNPSISNEWRPYTGPNPHTDHIHVSYKRQSGGYVNVDSTLTANKNIPFVDRIINAQNYPVHQNPDGTHSTHLMAYADNIAFPTLRYEKGKWITDVSPQQAMKAGDYIQFQTPEQAEYFSKNYKNSKLSHVKQTGGYAATPAQQHEGLNNPDYNKMFFPLQGSNQFRGLDNGQPVYLKDEQGNEQILYGPAHTANMQGAVYETRLNSKYRWGGKTY